MAGACANYSVYMALLSSEKMRAVVADHAAEQEEEIMALQSILDQDITGKKIK